MMMSSSSSSASPRAAAGCAECARRRGDHQCPYAMVPCPLPGCKATMPRLALPDHTLLHVATLSATVRDLQTDVSRALDAVHLQATQLTALESRLRGKARDDDDEPPSTYRVLSGSDMLGDGGVDASVPSPYRPFTAQDMDGAPPALERKTSVNAYKAFTVDDVDDGVQLQQQQQRYGPFSTGDIGGDYLMSDQLARVDDDDGDDDEKKKKKKGYKKMQLSDFIADGDGNAIPVLGPGISRATSADAGSSAYRAMDASDFDAVDPSADLPHQAPVQVRAYTQPEPSGREKGRRQSRVNLDVENSSCFHGNISRDVAKARLLKSNNERDNYDDGSSSSGYYLFRLCGDRSELIHGHKNPNLFVLSYFDQEGVMKNIKIFRFPFEGLSQTRDRSTAMYPNINALVDAIVGRGALPCSVRQRFSK